MYDALKKLKSDFGCQRITIQTGGTLNGLFLREKLIDFVDLIVAPILIGGKNTPTLIDGSSLHSETELSQLGVLQLQECIVLEDSYLRLQYKVIHEKSRNNGRYGVKNSVLRFFLAVKL